MLLHLVQTDYVGSVTQNDAAGATHLVTNTPPGPSTQQTSIFSGCQRPSAHKFKNKAHKIHCQATPAFTQRKQETCPVLKV